MTRTDTGVSPARHRVARRRSRSVRSHVTPGAGLTARAVRLGAAGALPGSTRVSTRAPRTLATNGGRRPRRGQVRSGRRSARCRPPPARASPPRRRPPPPWSRSRTNGPDPARPERRRVRSEGRREGVRTNGSGGCGRCRRRWRRVPGGPSRAVLTLYAAGELDPDAVDVQGRAPGGRSSRPACTRRRGGDGRPRAPGTCCWSARRLRRRDTCRAVATAMDVASAAARSTAEGDLDFRGTLGSLPGAPGRFRDIRLSFELDADLAPQQRRAARLTERYCVVLTRRCGRRRRSASATHSRSRRRPSGIRSVGTAP